jgi:hypothetical protein
MLRLPGSPVRVPAAVINYAGYVRDNIVSECPVGKDGKRDFEAVSSPNRSEAAADQNPLVVLRFQRCEEVSTDGIGAEVEVVAVPR